MAAWSATNAPEAHALDPLAPPVPVSPTAGAAHVAGQQIVFQIRSEPGDSLLWVHVSKSPQLDACGTIGFDAEIEPASATPADPSTYVAAPTYFSFPTFWMNSPGVYYWQVYRIHYGSGADGCVESPVQSFTITARPAITPPPVSPPTSVEAPAIAPTAGLAPDLISSSIGIRRRLPYALDLGLGASGVSRLRFAALVKNSARRWDLFLTGTSFDGVKVGDGRDEIGFGALPSAILGQTSSLIDSRYIRAPFRCRWVVNSTAKSLRCASGNAKWIARYGVEYDIKINPRITWEQGPDMPTRYEYDLETVLLHEIGHYVGNRHRPNGCASTLMMEDLARGEWWRTSYNWRRIGCTGVG